ncbi:hypothetical protein PAXRUDRAFT_147686 [Paxillus rubicundulus Ve08.2h10]|uniref:Uncharacterized protein n=1 Tax=Paxillus rubicundulus Ve08.2h10 TaxID=930991 RepID=A0A0D0E4P1_9AGAM|nr:hypothetical protein PAXRUDRAFT_147686 [Paxillus rubicundulus Ve08.2h10]
MDTREWIDAAAIGGSAPKELKQSLLDLVTTAANSAKVRGIRGFEPEWAAISVLKKAEEQGKLPGRVVFEATAEDDSDMLHDGNNTLHGGCAALFIDNCSITPTTLLRLATILGKADSGVSQSINILIHARRTGIQLRIVSTTISLGSRTLSSRCEIWDITNHWLVASGVHTGMSASVPRVSSGLCH